MPIRIVLFCPVTHRGPGSGPYTVRPNAIPAAVKHGRTYRHRSLYRQILSFFSVPRARSRAIQPMTAARTYIKLLTQFETEKLRVTSGGCG